MDAPFDKFAVRVNMDQPYGIFDVDCRLPGSWPSLTKQERQAGDEDARQFIEDAIREKLARERKEKADGSAA